MTAPAGTLLELFGVIKLAHLVDDGANEARGSA